jgi:hypothetical protein
LKTQNSKLKSQNHSCKGQKWLARGACYKLDFDASIALATFGLYGCGFEI